MPRYFSAVLETTAIPGDVVHVEQSGIMIERAREGLGSAIEAVIVTVAIKGIVTGPSLQAVVAVPANKTVVAIAGMKAIISIVAVETVGGQWGAKPAGVRSCSWPRDTPIRARCFPNSPRRHEEPRQHADEDSPERAASDCDQGQGHGYASRMR